MLIMHKTLLIGWLMYVQNILQPSFVGPQAFAYIAYAIIRPWAYSILTCCLYNVTLLTWLVCQDFNNKKFRSFLILLIKVVISDVMCECFMNHN